MPLYATSTADVLTKTAERLRDGLPAGAAVRRFDGSPLDAILESLAILAPADTSPGASGLPLGVLVGLASDSPVRTDATGTAKIRALDVVVMLVTLRTPRTDADAAFSDPDAERLDDAMDRAEETLSVPYQDTTPAALLGEGVTHVDIVARESLESTGDWYARALRVVVHRAVQRAPLPLQ